MKEETQSEAVENNEVEDNSANFEQIGCEKVEDLYWSGELMKPTARLFRLTSNKGRVYFRFQDQDNFRNPILYFGATSVQDEAPTSKQLIDWKVSRAASDGNDSTERYVWQRTLFGSLSHTMIADFVNNGEIDLRAIPTKVREYFNAHTFYCTEEELKDMSVELQKDMLSFRRWVQDHDVKFIGIEVPIYSDIEGMASQIDILCFMNWRKTAKEDWKRVFAIIDYKSTKKGARPEMRMQLHSYKNILIEMFPELSGNNIMLFNLMGKNWRSTNWNAKSKPYLLTNQTEKHDEERYGHYVELAKITAREKFGRRVSFIDGNMKLTDDPTQFVKTKTIRQIIEDGDWQGLFANEQPEIFKTVA